MKKILLFLSILVFEAQADNPLLVVVIMVKDEAPVMVKTLQPFVDGGVKNFLIFDTGSTDGTQDIAREYFKKEGLTHAHVLEEPFIDFATSYSHALDNAERLFPEATFMLLPDAEWYMQNVEGLLEFCEKEKNSTHPCYYVQMQSFSADGSKVLSYVVDRLIRTGTNVRFVGVVYEVLKTVPTVTVPATTYFEWRACTTGRQKSAERWKRDKNLLLKKLEQDPYDSRTLFYLAQVYGGLGDWENAYASYKKRAAVGGWDEENFITLLRLGDTAQNLPSLQEQSLTHGAPNVCPTAIRHYLEAYALRPTRAESLVRIAEYYLETKQMSLAFLFAAQAARIPYPERDILFVEKEKYTFARYNVLGIAAWYVQEYELGEWAVRKALEAMPDTSHLHYNLKLYLDRKKELAESITKK